MAVPPPRPRRPRRWPAAVAVAGAAITLAACTTGSAGSGDTSAPGPGPTTAPPTTPGPTSPTGGGGTPGGSVTGGPTGPAGSSGPAGTGTGGPGSGAPATGAPKTVHVQITISDWNAAKDQAEVDAFVPGSVISGGTCTLTLTKGGTHRQADHPAITTPSSTSCGLITIAGAQLSAGSWQAVVSFRAPTATGTSDPVTIKVPA